MMKKLFWLLVPLFLLLAAQVEAQQFCRRYTGTLTSSTLTLTDGTETLTIDFSSTIPRIYSSDPNLYFGTSSSGRLALTDTTLEPLGDGATALGTATKGYSALHLSNGTDRWSLTPGTNTLDITGGATDQILNISASTAYGAAYGAGIQLRGNTDSADGDVYIGTGNAAGSDMTLGLYASDSDLIIVDDASANLWTFAQAGNITSHNNINWYIGDASGEHLSFYPGHADNDIYFLDEGGAQMFSIDTGSETFNLIGDSRIYANGASTGIDFTEAGYVQMPASADLPNTCTTGEIYFETDDDACGDSTGGTGSVCACVNSAWVEIS